MGARRRRTDRGAWRSVRAAAEPLGTRRPSGRSAKRGGTTASMLAVVERRRERETARYRTRASERSYQRISPTSARDGAEARGVTRLPAPDSERPVQEVSERRVAACGSGQWRPRREGHAVRSSFQRAQPEGSPTDRVALAATLSSQGFQRARKRESRGREDARAEADPSRSVQRKARVR